MAKTMVGRDRELLNYYKAIVRSLWFLTLCTLIAGAGAYVVSKLQAPVFRATTLLIVDPRVVGQDPYSSLLASDQLVTTYESLITQPTGSCRNAC